MLVLSLKIDGSIEIEGGVRVTVTEVRGGRVQFSIQAPPDVRVLRKEILDGRANFSESQHICGS